MSPFPQCSVDRFELLAARISGVRNPGVLEMNVSRHTLL